MKYAARILTLVTILGGAGARADVLDQSFLVDLAQNDPYNFSVAVATGQALGQSFTVGLDGTLSRVGVQIFKNTGAVGDVTLTIRNVSAGFPSASASSSLYSTIISLASIPTFETPAPSVGHTLVDVSAANLSVTAGQQYAIVLSRSAPGSAPFALWRGGGVNLYAGGNWAVQAVDGDPWGMPFGSYDLGFQTYVDTGAVPEPSLLWLALAGMPAIVLARRRAA